MIVMVSANCHLDKPRVSWEGDCSLSVPVGDYFDILADVGRHANRGQHQSQGREY